MYDLFNGPWSPQQARVNTTVQDAVMNYRSGVPCLCQLRTNNTWASSADSVLIWASFLPSQVPVKPKLPPPPPPPRATCCISSLLTSSSVKIVQGSLLGSGTIVLSHALSACFRLAVGTKKRVTKSPLSQYVKSNNIRKASCCFKTSHHQCFRFNIRHYCKKIHQNNHRRILLLNTAQISSTGKYTAEKWLYCKISVIKSRRHVPHSGSVWQE